MFIFNLLDFILICLLSYMFFRLLCLLHKNDILKDIDIFFITSTPWEFKKYKNDIEKNSD